MNSTSGTTGQNADGASCDASTPNDQATSSSGRRGFLLKLSPTRPDKFENLFWRREPEGATREKGRAMSEKGQRRYHKLERADRAAVERGPDKNWTAHKMAADLGRSPSSITNEVRRNRTVTKGLGKGERVTEVPETAYLRVLARPWVCNACNKRRHHCSMSWRCKYSAEGPGAGRWATCGRSEGKFERITVVRARSSRRPRRYCTAG